MPNLLKLKRGTAATIPVGSAAEPLFTTDTYDLYIGKGNGSNQRFQKYIASGTSSQFLKGDGSLDSNTYQQAIMLTTTGSSGASTFVSNTLNVPNYSLSGLGGVPTSRQLTINGTAYDLSADRTWSVGTVTSVAALTIGTSGTDLSSTVATGTTTPVITLNVPTASATNRGALSSADWTTFNNKQSALTFSSPIVNTSGTISIPAATTSVNGYLTSTDWTTFNSKEPAITAGTTLQYYRGDKTFQTLNTSVVPESGSIYFTEPRVLATVLTGLNLSGGGTIAATDSILTAFGKVQNQISALVGGVYYKGTWNASTNTPTLTSSTGTKGWYYIVTVAGSTNLDGITDWKVGDWAIFNGTTWDKVDNTDAVSSVNGFTGAVNLGLGDISNVTLTSPTNAQLLRFNGTSSKWENWTPTYISGNQTITLSGDVSGSGATAITTTIGALKVTNAMLAGTIDYAKMDATTVPTWNQNTTGSAATLTTARTLTIGATGKTFNGSANVSWSLAEIGAAAALSGTINTIAYWDSASTIASLSTATYPSLTELSYVKGVTSAIQTQLNAKEPTVTKGNLTEATSSVLTITGGTGAVIGSGTTIQVKLASGTQSGYLSSTDWTTFNNKQNAITLTTTGTSGAATLVGATLNIPQYQSVLTNPVTGTGTNNYIPKFTATGSTIGDSSLYYSQGANSNAYTFGSVGAGAIYNVSQFNIYSNATSEAFLQWGSNKYLYIGNSSGNVSFSSINTGTHNYNNIIYYNGASASDRYISFGTEAVDRLTIEQNGDIQLNKYTSNGFVKTSGGVGTITIDTTSYLPLTGGTLTGALSGTSATFSSSVTAGAKLESSFANTGGSIDNNAYLRLVNTGAATLNQSVDIVMRWQDGTYNGTGGISMVRESATARSGKLILQPIDSSGNNVSALTLASTGAATFSSSVRATSYLETRVASNNQVVLNNVSGSAYYGFILNPATDKWSLGYGTSPTTLGTSVLTWTQGGSVGIGTASPQATLHIVSPVVSAGTALKVVSDGNSNDKVFEFTGADGVAAQTMVMTQGGNVGIGTTSPSYKFHVVGSDTGGGALIYSGNSSSNYSLVVGDYATNTNFHIRGDGVAYLRGNVGIGTTSPGMALDVVAAPVTGYTSTRPILNLSSNEAYSVAPYCGINFSAKYNSSGTYTSLAFIGGGKETTGDGVYGGYLRFNTRTDGASDIVERMRITSGGNVGIGTTSPGTKLHVVGGNDNTLTIDNDGSAYTSTFWRNNNNNRAQIYFNNTAKEFGIGTLDASGYIAFQTASATERMRITSSGATQIKGTLQTYAPGSTSVLGDTWKLGGFTNTSVLAATGYLYVQVNGADYYIGLVTPL